MMNPGESAFLVLCEELNFTRAAERCHMTQQGLSFHIRKLEEQYHTKLFLRVPTVEITETGKALRMALLKKEGLEDDLLRTIQEIDSGTIGKIRFGLNGARASFLAPEILKKYSTQYRDVEVQFTTGDTGKLLRLLREGKIDGLLGVNAPPAPDLVLEPLVTEEVFLVLHREIYDEIMEEMEENPDPDGSGLLDDHEIPEISLKDLLARPELIFVRNEEGSTLNKLIDELAGVHDMHLKTQALISDYHVQTSLCLARGLSMFCPRSIAFSDSGPLKHKSLRAVRIRELKKKLTVCLITGTDRYYPACVEMFFNAVRSLKKENSHRGRFSV